MTTTRRLSGLNSNQPGATSASSASLMLETYEIFKRKHLSQNKEIIHKNSELTKANSDLQRRISLLRAENLSLKGAHFQLECENAGLRDRLERSEERERERERERETLNEEGKGRGMDAGQTEAMLETLANTVQALHAFESLLRPSPSVSSPSPTPSTTIASAQPPLLNNISLSRRRSTAACLVRPSISTRPDLSYISEGEGSNEGDDIGEREAGWGGSVLEGLREEPLSQPVPTPSSSPSSPPIVQPPIVAPRTKPATKPRLPPPASSSSASTSTSDFRRPARRVSGLVRPPPALVGASTGGKPRLGFGSEGEALERIERRAAQRLEGSERVVKRGESEGKGKGREVLREVQGVRRGEEARERRVLSSSSEDEDAEEAGGESEEEEEKVPPSATETRGWREAGGQETVLGTAKVRSPGRSAEGMKPVEEEEGSRASSRGPPVEEEAVREGRRARKSVNYALPSLNTKMRRPQDYVATITAAAKPRKSSKPTSSTSSAPSSSAPPSASGASRKPRSTTPTPVPLSMPLSTPGGGTDSEGEESFPARTGSRAGMEQEERSRTNGGNGVGSRRRSMAG